MEGIIMIITTWLFLSLTAIKQMIPLKFDKKNSHSQTYMFACLICSKHREPSKRQRNIGNLPKWKTC